MNSKNKSLIETTRVFFVSLHTSFFMNWFHVEAKGNAVRFYIYCLCERSDKRNKYFCWLDTINMIHFGWKFRHKKKLFSVIVKKERIFSDDVLFIGKVNMENWPEKWKRRDKIDYQLQWSCVSLFCGQHFDNLCGFSDSDSFSKRMRCHAWKNIDDYSISTLMSCCFYFVKL